MLSKLFSESGHSMLGDLCLEKNYFEFFEVVR